MRRIYSILFLLLPALAFAANDDARLKFLIKRLGGASDARGRAQAALILGTSGESEALDPLCAALSDKDELVRSAAANALAELGDVHGLDCLRRAPGSEARARAIASLERTKNRRPEIYVSITPINDDRDRPDAATAALVSDLLRRHLTRIGALVAPQGENKKQAAGVLKAKKLRGYQIMPKIQSAGAGVRLVLVGLTYPGNAIQGEVSAKAGGADAATLLKALVPAVVKDAASTFEWGVTP